MNELNTDNISMQQSHARFMSKAIMSGLRGYLEAEVELGQARDAREQAILQRNLENKAIELRDIRLLANQKEFATHQAKVTAEVTEGSALRQIEARIKAAEDAGAPFTEVQIQHLYATGNLPTAPTTQQRDFAEASSWWDTEYQRLNKDLQEGQEPQLPLGMTKEDWFRERGLLTKPTSSASEIKQQDRDAEFTDAYQYVMKENPPDGVDINTAIGSLPEEQQQEIFEARRRLTSTSETLKEKADFDDERIQNYMKQVPGSTYIEAGIALSNFEKVEPSVTKLFNEILPNIKKVAKGKNWNLTPLQMLQIAMGQSITDDKDEGTFADFQKTIQGVTHLRTQKPDRFPTEIKDWEIAFAIHKIGEDLMAGFKSQARYNLFDDPMMVPNNVPGKSKEEALANANTQVLAATDILAMQLSDGNPKVKQVHLRNMLESYEKLINVSNPEIAMITVAESMLSTAVNGTSTAAEKERYAGRLRIAEEILNLEKALLILYSDHNKKLGFRKDKVADAFQAVGLEMTEGIRLDMSLDNMVTLLAQQYRLTITGKAFRPEEQKEVQLLLPSSGQPFKTNISKIHTWLGATNTELDVLLRQKFGAPFAHLIPDFYRIGGSFRDPETDKLKYRPSSRITNPELLAQAKPTTTPTTTTPATPEKTTTETKKEPPEITRASERRVPRQEGPGEAATATPEKKRLTFEKRIGIVKKMGGEINEQDTSPQEKQQSINVVSSHLRRRGYHPDDIDFIIRELQRRAGIREGITDEFRDATDPSQIRARMRQER